MDVIEYTDRTTDVGFHNLMKASYLIMTDSGGIQEEARHWENLCWSGARYNRTSGKVWEAGTLKLAGTKMEDIYRECRQLLQNLKFTEG